MWLQDTGILIKLRDSELKAPNKIPLAKVKSNEPLKVFQLATIFIFAAIGLVLSVSMFLMELIIGRKIISESIRSKIARGRVGQKAKIRQRQIVIESGRNEDMRGRRGGKNKIEVGELEITAVTERGDIIMPRESGDE